MRSPAIPLMRPPRTIKAALLAGFLVIIAVWLASAFSFTNRLAETQEQSAAIQTRYARGQDLLFAIRSQVLLGSIYVRDALIETGPFSTESPAAGDLLRSLQAQVNQELEQYKAIESAGRGASWTQLEDELRGFWDAAVRVVT